MEIQEARARIKQAEDNIRNIIYELQAETDLRVKEIRTQYASHVCDPNSMLVGVKIIMEL